jgi:hypothetical protein
MKTQPSALNHRVDGYMNSNRALRHIAYLAGLTVMSLGMKDCMSAAKKENTEFNRIAIEAQKEAKLPFTCYTPAQGWDRHEACNQAVRNYVWVSHPEVGAAYAQMSKENVPIYLGGLAVIFAGLGLGVAGAIVARDRTD